MLKYSSRIVLAFGMALASAAPGFTQEAEHAYRMRASIYAEKALVTAASWVGVKGRKTIIKQTFSTPYQRDIALNKAGKSAEGIMEGDITIVVRPFEDRGTLCLDVEIASYSVSNIHHYRSESMLEILPGGASFLAGGSYCDSEKAAGGQLFNLSLADNDNYAEIFVVKEQPIDGAGN